MTLTKVTRCTMLVIIREERRLRKWRKMIGVGGTDWKHYVRRKPQVVKRRVRKGIPDCLRGLVWQLISGSRDLLLMNQGVYEVLHLTQSVVDCKFLLQIHLELYFAFFPWSSEEGLEAVEDNASQR